MKDLKNVHGVQYVLTRKLNEDILENLFSFLKGMACDGTYWVNTQI